MQLYLLLLFLLHFDQIQSLPFDFFSAIAK